MCRGTTPGYASKQVLMRAASTAGIPAWCSAARTAIPESWCAGFARALNPEILRVALARVETIGGRAVVGAHLDHVRVAEIEHFALRQRRRVEARSVPRRFHRQAGDHVPHRAVGRGIDNGLAGIRIALEPGAGAKRERKGEGHDELLHIAPVNQLTVWATGAK
ncbi:hypothetical protein PT2222_230137 [Paraburkholderia tropica]